MNHLKNFFQLFIILPLRFRPRFDTMRAERKSDTMMTASEYSYMTDARKREYALAVDAMEDLCRDSISLLHRMQTALLNGDNGRAEYERYEIALMMKRNEIFSRQFEYQMAGINIQISTDDRGTPIRVRRPAGFVSLEMMAANAAAQNASEDETNGAPLPDAAIPARKRGNAAHPGKRNAGDTALPRAAVSLRK